MFSAVSVVILICSFESIGQSRSCTCKPHDVRLFFHLRLTLPTVMCVRMYENLVETAIQRRDVRKGANRTAGVINSQSF